MQQLCWLQTLFCRYKTNNICNRQNQQQPHCVHKIININMLQLKGKPFKNSRLFTGAVISDSVYFEQTSINSNTDAQIHTIVAINETQRIFFLSSFFLPPLVEFNKSETSCLFSNEKTPDIIIMMQKPITERNFVVCHIRCCQANIQIRWDLQAKHLPRSFSHLQHMKFFHL